jgi:hypothetical protein
MSAVSATPAVGVPRGEARSAFRCAGLLLFGAIVSASGALVGVVRTFDGSALGQASGALWVLLLPPVLAVSSIAYRPPIGLAVSAGVGMVSLARLITDLMLSTDPNSVLRPEFFYEVSHSAQPFRPAAGGWLVALGDALMLVAGVVAARRLGSLFFRSERIFDAEPLPAADGGSGPQLLAEALRSTDFGFPADSTGSRPDAGPARSNALVAAGFSGALILLAASLGLPYTGGYLADRYLPAQLSLWGIAAAIVVAVVTAGAVLAAGGMPRQLATGLLGGVGAGAAVPFLTAVAVRAAGAPVQLTAVVGMGLAGSALLAAAGLLGRVVPGADERREPSNAAVRRLNTVGALLTLLTGAAAAAAWRLPQLLYNGGADPTLPSGFPASDPLSLPYLIATAVPVVGGVLWLVPRWAPAGRAVASVCGVPLVFAVAQSLHLLGDLQASATVPNLGFAAPQWSAGAGLWSGIAGSGLVLVVVAVAVLANRQTTQAAPAVADEESLAESRAFRTRVAIALSGLTVIALILPVYRSPTGSSPTLLVGFDLGSWGVLALAVGMVCAAWAAAWARQAVPAAAYALTGGAILFVRLLIPSSVRAGDGFAVRAGLYLGFVTVLAFALSALVLSGSARRIRMVNPDPVIDRPVGRKVAAAKRKPPQVRGEALAVRPPGGKRSGAASSNRTKGRPR